MWTPNRQINRTLVNSQQTHFFGAGWKNDDEFTREHTIGMEMIEMFANIG